MTSMNMYRVSSKKIRFQPFFEFTLSCVAKKGFKVANNADILGGQVERGGGKWWLNGMMADWLPRSKTQKLS